MTRLQILQQIYAQYNAIFTALILVAVWAGVAGHLCDMLTEHRWKQIVPVYWTVILLAYIGGIVFVGLEF